MIRSRSFIATPPGATIKEQLADRGLSQKDFAFRMDMSEKHISKLINGEVQLTPTVARRLEMVLGIPSSFWLSLEARYRDKLAKVEEENQMEADKEIAKEIPYNEMAKYEWVPKTTNSNEKVINLRKYFEIARLDLLGSAQVTQIACRRMATGEKQDYALLAMAQQARIEARKIQTNAINIEGLQHQISEIRNMTLMDPEEFCPKLSEILSEYGIAIVFLPHIKGSFLHGASFYDGKKIVVGLTVRGKYADKFWFSLFHELAHILYGHIGQKDGTSEDDERAADEYAKNTLVPQEKYDLFVQLNKFDQYSLINFSNQLGIDVGIVVGRLQKEGYINYNRFNHLKHKYAYAQ